MDNLHARIQKLEAVRLEAEGQLLHRAAVGYQAGELSMQDLVDIYGHLKEYNLAGRSTRWDAIMPVGWADVAYEFRMGWAHAPNGPEGTWIGTWPETATDRRPRPHTPVVYVLFDAASEPIYVGSTGSLFTRLKKHAQDGKPFVAWQAYRASSREAAYQLEDRLLKERLPSLNKKRGR